MTTYISLKSHVDLAMTSHQLLVDTLEDARWYLILTILTNFFFLVILKVRGDGLHMGELVYIMAFTHSQRSWILQTKSVCSLIFALVQI